MRRPIRWRPKISTIGCVENREYRDSGFGIRDSVKKYKHKKLLFKIQNSSVGTTPNFELPSFSPYRKGQSAEAIEGSQSVVMNLVKRNLYIGSLEDANNVESMKNAGIAKIISIGCPSPKNELILEHLTYEDILDTPEQSIIGILSKTNEFIRDSLASDEPILVNDNSFTETV